MKYFSVSDIKREQDSIRNKIVMLSELITRYDERGIDEDELFLLKIQLQYCKLCNMVVDMRLRYAESDNPPSISDASKVLEDMTDYVCDYINNNLKQATFNKKFARKEPAELKTGKRFKDLTEVYLEEFNPPSNTEYNIGEQIANLYNKSQNNENNKA